MPDILRLTQMMPILIYHTVGDYPSSLPSKTNISLELFTSHMEYFKRNGVRVLPLEQVITVLREEGRCPGPGAIAVTFDDGYADNYHHVFPLIKQYGFPITIFLTTGQIGSRWKTPAGPVEGLEWDQIKEMSRSGMVTFGSHGTTHSNLTLLSGTALHEEIADSKKQIENGIGKEIQYISYPFGACNAAVETITRECGYQAGFSVWKRKHTLFSLPRVPIACDDGLRRLGFKISRYYFPVKRCVKWNYRY